MISIASEKLGELVSNQSEANKVSLRRRQRNPISKSIGPAPVEGLIKS